MAKALINSSGHPFPSLIGQNQPRDLLMRVIRSGRLAHAYLFIGPEGTGKRALAIELARVLNCPKGVEIAAFGCDCHSCVSMMKWRHPNLLTIFPLPRLDKDKGESSDKALAAILSQLEANPYTPVVYSVPRESEIDPTREARKKGPSESREILIDHIREARNKVSLAPDRDGMRVLFIHPADAMNDESANALLKLLEEPPDKCLLILTAESRRGVLPTILSRCQQIWFSPLPEEIIAEALISRNGIDPDRATTIASLANGSFTHALELLTHQTGEMTADSLEFLRSAAVGNVAKIAESVEKWLEDATRTDVKDRLDITNLWLLDALTTIASSNGSKPFALRIPNSGPSVVKMGERYGAEKLLKAMSELEEAKLAIDANAMQSLALTALAIKLKRIFQS